VIGIDGQSEADGRKIARPGGEGETPVGLKAASFRFALTPGKTEKKREF
jgi:hypothetical protein